MNINNGKTGNVNIPGALHSTGGDGDGQVGGVVAYAGDVYDETLGKNQKEINQTLLDGSEDSNVIAVALNDLNEKVEEQEKVTSNALNDLSDKTDNLNKDVENLEKTTSSSLNDLNDRVDTLDDKVDDNELAINDLISSKLSLDDNNNLIVNPESEVESTATNSLIGGIATVGKGAYSIAFAGNAQKVYISGNASDGYQLQASDTSSFDPTNFIRPIFENIYKDTYLLHASTYEKVAKITAVTPNTDGLKISITLDTDLGTLTNTLYRLENISKNKSFNFGVFGNTGDWSSILGYGSYNTGNYSNVIGSNNYNSKTYSTLIGTQNVNKGNYSTLIGYNNKATAGNYPCAIGIENTLNAYGYAIGRKNVINGNGYSIGFDNLINTNGTATAFLIGHKLVCENSRGGFFIGQYNKEYISNDASIANLFAVGCGDQNSPRQNGIEIKQNLDTYIYGVGGFTGGNSDVNTTKSLQTILSELQTSSTNLNGHFTDNNSIKIGTAINVSGKDSLAGGAGVSLTGNRSFGYGISMGAIYLTGNNGSYSARLHSNANYTNANNIGSVFATTHLNSYLLNTSNFSRVAKITNIVYNGADQPLTLTLDTDLGELTNAVYAIENVAGTKSFNGGSFGNTGQNSSVIGLNNFNTGTQSNILGSVNANTADTATVLGYLNKNNGSNSNVFGLLNDNSGTYGNVIGLQNTNSGQYANIVGRNNNNKCNSTNILGIANIVNETTYPSSILGFENIVDVATQQFTLGYGNHGTRGQYAEGNASASWMIGHHLTTSSGCWALGKYNKDYDVQDVAKQNFFVIGQGDTNAPLNSVELKRNGNLYIFNVGGFNGTNSDNANIKTLQTVIDELQNTVTSLQSRITALENQLNGGNS